MKKEFSIIKNRPKINLELSRDSVCAGDDIDAPHKKVITQPSFTDPVAFINHISTGYLPTVAGVGHTWDCLLNGKVVGTVSVTKTISKIRDIQYKDENSIHFRYNSATY